MANTMTNVVDTIFAQSLLALRGFATMPRLVLTDLRNATAEQGDVINVTIPSIATVGDVTPANTPPAGDNLAPTKAPIALDQWRMTKMHLTDKEAREVAMSYKAGTMNSEVSERMRVLAEDVNAYIMGLYTDFYGLAGTAGTTPFGSDHTDATAARKLLNLQRAPLEPRRVVLDPDAMANLLGNRTILDAGFRRQGEDTARTGLVGEFLGFDWYEDQQVPTHTVNAIGAGALTVNGVNAVGASSVSIAKGAGANWSALKGDIITFAGDSQQYVITANTTVTQNTNTSVPISPTLKVATAGGEAVTVAGSHTANLAFHRDAIALAVRPLAAAEGFSGGNEIRTAVDPVSGLALTLEVSREHMRTAWTFSILYGAKVIRPELGVRIAG